MWAEESPGGGCPKCRKPLQVTGAALRSDLRLQEVGSKYECWPRPASRLILSQEIDGLMVKCNDSRCSWVGKKADYLTHWVAACPVRAINRFRYFAPLYDELQGSESDASTLVTESRKSSPSVQPMTIAVKTIEGRTMKLQVLRSDSVKRLKEAISENQGIDPAVQRLIFGGKRLEDEKTLEEYGLGPDMTAHLGGFGCVPHSLSLTVLVDSPLPAQSPAHWISISGTVAHCLHHIRSLTF